MNDEKIRLFLLEHKGKLITISKSDNDEYIEMINYCSDRGLIKKEGSSYRLSSEGTDLLKAYNKKPLHLKILEYLKTQEALYKKIDIGAPFLIDDDSKEIRDELGKAITYLEKERFVELDGYPPSLSSTVAGKFPSKYITGIKATITKLGKKEIEPMKQKPHIQIGQIGHTINGPISASNLSTNNDYSLNKQTITTIDKKSKEKSRLEILPWIMGIIVGLLAIYKFLHKIHFELKF